MKYKNEIFGFEEKPDFAFIDKIYVHRSILRKYNITEDCDVIAKVVLSGDNKWKVYDLDIKK